MTGKDVSRFMRKVEMTNDCWLWCGALDAKGYGRFSVGSSKTEGGKRRNSMVAAHRFSFSTFKGEIGAGLFVCHHCDNPRCVKPDHLFLGTNADNVRDMDAKGRRVNKQPKGSAHGNAILNEEAALAIYQAAISGVVPQAELARRHGVCLATVNHIKTGRLWSHVTGARR